MKFKKIDYDIYEIIANGAMSAPFIGEGRLIPGLVVDTGTDDNLRELIEYHQDTPPGDTVLLWSKKALNNKRLVLNIEFSKPMELQFGIGFDVHQHYSLIDGIIQSRGFYLQAGRPGDKFSNLDISKILLEVPNLGFDQQWESLLVDTIRRQYRRDGLSRKDANLATQQHVKSMREVWRIRRPEK